MAVPYAWAPGRPLPTAEEMLQGFIPAAAPTPGSMMAPPGQTAASEMTYPGQLPDMSTRLQALGAGMLTPFGFAPPPMHVMQDVPSLSGAETLPTPVASADLGAAAAGDPAGASIGGMLGMGPAFRLAGAVGRGAMSIPGVRQGVEGVGQALARPAVGVPLALGGSLAATTGSAQAPTATGPKTAEAQTALEAARKRLTEVETRRRQLQQQADRYTPENRNKLTEADIRDAQSAMGARVDGKRGPETNGVLDRRHRQLLAEIEALGTRETTVRADIKTAEDRRKEAEGLDLADAGRRMLEESQPGPLEAMIPTVGAYGAGAIGGHMFRNWLARGTTRRAAAQKAEVDAVSSQLGQGDIPTRVGRLNELWTQGAPPTPFSRGTAPPFAFTPSGSPSLHTPSPVAPWSSVTHEIAPGMMGGNMTRSVMSPDQLYRPSLGTLYGPTAATAGLGGIESGAAQFLMLPRAQQKLAEAQAAMERQGPTPENVDALTSARREVAFWEGMQNFGRGAVGGALGAEMMHPLRNLPRPSMAAAEAERGALDLLLHPRAPVTPTPPTPPAPVPPTHHIPGAYQNRAGRWMVMTPRGPRWIPNP